MKELLKKINDLEIKLLKIGFWAEKIKKEYIKEFSYCPMNQDIKPYLRLYLDDLEELYKRKVNQKFNFLSK